MNPLPFSVLALSVFTVSGALYSQNIVLSGSVKDRDSEEPLIGAHVSVGELGTSTDYDGRFQLRLAPGEYTLHVSYVGYEVYEKRFTWSAGETLELKIRLASESTVLNMATVSTGRYKKPLSEVTVSLEVLQPDLINNTNKITLDQAIEKIPGVRVIDGQANIRGGSGFSQGAGSRVLLLVDDIPILQADAGFPNWSDVPMEIIDQVEVIKGAASALYGSSALNGIINVRTAYARSEPETRGSIFYNHFFTPGDPQLRWWDRSPYSAGANMSHKQRFNRFDLVLGAFYVNTEGFNQGAYNKYGRFNFNTRYRLADRLSFGLNGNFNRGGNRSFFYWKSDIEGYQGSPNTYSTSDRFRFNLDPHLTYFDKSGNRHRILGRLYRVDNNLEEGRSNQSWQHYAEYQVQRNLKAWDMVITGGAVVSGSHVDAELYGDTTFTSRNYAVYLQADKKFFERLNISGGFRFEDNLLINPGFTYALGMVEPSREREAKPVFRLGMNYQLMEASFLRASYGQGYRYPTIAEKFIFTDVGGFFVRPNPTLRSETGWSTEVGLKQGFRISSFEGYLDLSAFWFKYFNMMEFNLVATGGRAAFQATNIGDTETRGYEVTMAGRGKFFGLPTSLLAGYVYIDPRFLEFDLSPVLPGEPQSVGQVNAINSSSEDNILKYRSRHNLKFDLESNWKAFMLGLEYFHSSDMEAIDRIFNIIVPGLQRFREANDRGYHLCNARAAYRFSEKFRFSMLLNNIFNEVYSVRPGMLDAPRNLTAKVDVAF